MNLGCPECGTLLIGRRGFETCPKDGTRNPLPQLLENLQRKVNEADVAITKRNQNRDFDWQSMTRAMWNHMRNMIVKGINLPVPIEAESVPNAAAALVAIANVRKWIYEARSEIFGN